MSLITRMTRLFRADMNAVLDSIEEPVALLSQSVRDMSEAISHQERSLALIQQEMNDIQAFRKKAEGARDNLAKEIQLCLDSDEDDLARGLIRKQLEFEHQLAAALVQREYLESKAESVSEQLRENKAQLDSVAQKLSLFHSDEARSKLDYGPAPASFNERFNTTVSNEQVEVALLAEKQRRASQ